MSEKVIRLWDGCTVVGVMSVDQKGGSTFIGAVSGAANSTKVDIELDPWAGLIVDHSTRRSPVGYREDQWEHS